MSVATRAVLILVLAGCASSKTVSAPKPVVAVAATAAAQNPAAKPLASAPGVGFSDSGEFAFQLDPAPGSGSCLAQGKLLALANRLCPATAAAKDRLGPCIERETPVQVQAAQGLCGNVRQVAVADAGKLIAFASDREGLFLRAGEEQPLAPISGFVARHTGELADLIGPASLLFFSGDGHALFLAPLDHPPIAIDVAARAEVAPSPGQKAEIERRSLVKARIRLLARDTRLKEVGLRWAMRLGDTRNIDAIARIAATTKDPTVQQLANAIMEEYTRELRADRPKE